MALHSDIKELLVFLKENQIVRHMIRAEPNKTLLYAGHFNAPVWMQIVEDKRTQGLSYEKTILPDVLERIQVPGQQYGNLLEWAKKLDTIQPWEQNGYIIWRALSGIFASNAMGAVSFMIGSGVSKAENKVFAATEISVLNRNQMVDNVTKDAIQYYLRCIETKQSDMNLSLIHG